MNQHLNRLAWVWMSLALAASLDAWFALAGPMPPPARPKDAELNDAIRLVPNRRAAKSLQAAADLVQQKEWAEATRILQSLLDMKEDAFIQVRRPQPDNDQAMQWTSVRAEVNRILAALPREGAEVYEVLCGAKARAVLAEARKAGDAQLLADLTQRFLHTKAGAEAAELLGTYHLDRGRPVLAALCFERLLHDRHGAAVRAPATWLKAVLAFRRSGDAARADQAWQRLRELSPQGVELAGRKVALRELEQAWAGVGAEASPASPYDWTMLQGNPSRSARSRGDLPFLDEDTDRWVQPTLQRAEAKQWLTQAVARQENRHQGVVLPAGFPVAVRDLLVYRGHGGLVAVEAATGKLRWELRSEWSLEGMTADPARVVALNQWVTMYLEGGNPGMLYENSTLGTLSTDQALVFAVDDLAVPPHPSFTQQNAVMQGRAHLSGALSEATQSNRLQAVELDTGKLRWQLGGPGERGEFSECFFLGAPLPLGGKLYVLTEKNAELRLVCLDAGTGKPHWSQTLATVRDRLALDVGRRLRGVHLAYADGVLVCPTNAGAILGIDLLTHSLLWAKPYREAVPAAEANPDINRRRLLATRYGQAFRPDWKDSAPVIQDGKVVFTAPDGAAVHCLNVRDGATLWKAEREDDLYLGGVHDGRVLLVGKHRCRALRLEDGQPAWACDTGVPSGRGVAGDGLYYLPLRAAAGGQGPEVCAIDIVTGKVVSHARTQQQEVPGNLLFCAGRVISQGVRQVCAYPQLQVKLARVEDQLRRRPDDPAVLLARGDVRLSQGDLPGAVADLRAALAKQPGQELLPRVREKLFGALTELLQNDFPAGEAHLDEYRALCQVAAASDATAEKKQHAEQETQRRRQLLARLVAAGRERQGRWVEAFQAYLEFAAMPGDRSQPAALGEPAVQARPDVWVRGRIAALASAVPASERQPLDEAMRQRWQSLATDSDLAALRRFAAIFDAGVPAGQQARLRLAELLAESTEPRDFLEAELSLLQIREAADGEPAARALAALARLLARNELYEDAASCYAQLGGDFAQVRVGDQTGAELLQEARRDPRLAAFLEPAKSRWPQGQVEGRSGPGDPRGTHAVLHLLPAGEVLPFFHKHDLTLDTGTFQLRLTDRARGDERCAQPLARSQVYFNLLSAQAPRCYYHAAGHVVILNIGHLVYAYDAAGKKLLWERNLLPSGAAAHHILPDGEGGYRAFYADGRVQTVGRVGPVTAAYVCLQTQDGLLALDPLRGDVLWSRGDFPEQAQVFGDAQRIYCVRTNLNGQGEAAFAVRAVDGSSVAVPDFTAAFNLKRQTRGRQLLLADPGAADRCTLRLYDPAAGTDLWRQEFSPRALMVQSEDPALAAVVEPDRDGRLTVFDLRTRKPILSARVEPHDLEKVAAAHLLHDRERFYLALSAPADAAAKFARGPLLGLAGVPAVPVNGALYAFDRASGKRCWSTRVAHQLLVRQEFADLPVVLCVARYVKLPGAGARQATLVQSFDKRTGQPVFEQEFANAAQFHSLRVRPAERRIELLGYTAKVEYTWDAGQP